ncbi:aldolase [Hesseltinella vesiculosa]|uniref:Aldolase n=1 Tax=Hesseltinella vesiculosa TaxID=101127 RepID=A0A1X2GDE4_9FUNG|nr:aldolase [Hesseltinella vesiculosa]
MNQTPRFIPYSVAMVTPFTKDGALDIDSVPAVVQYYLQQDIPGLLVSGSTGEQHCMTIDERKKLFRCVATNVKQQCELYAGVAAFKTADAVALAEAAEEAGFSGIMLGFPPYRRPTQHEAEVYVQKIASSVHLPIFIYNNPPRTGFDLHPSTFVRLAQSLDNVCGVKEAGTPENVKIIQQALGPAAASYSFFSGSDATFITAYDTHGYNGLTSIAGNVYPAQVKAIVDALQNNQLDHAQHIMDSILPGIQLLTQGGVLASIKYILRKKNVPIGYCTEPLLDVSDDIKLAIDRIFFPE